MMTRLVNLLILLVFVCSLLLSGSAGCSSRKPVQAAAPPAPAPAPEPVIVKHFVLTETGQRYYIDNMGRRHLIVREVVEPAGVRGVFYYIEDDERPYSLDEGERLYYRDASGRIFYLEEVRPARSMQPEVIIRESGPAVVVEPGPAMPRQSCAEQWNSCMDGCRGISPRQTYDRPNCVSNCDAIRSQCRD